MFINPTLLLLLALMFVFAPSLQEWVLTGGTAWYRPWLVWAVLVLFIVWSYRDRSKRQP